MSDGEGKKSGGYVVEHNAGAFGETFELADGWGLEYVDDSEEEEREGSVMPVCRNGNQGDQLAGDFIDDDMTGVFAAGFPSDDCGSGDPDEGRSEGCNHCPEYELEWRGMKGVCGSKPEQEGGDRTVSSGTRAK